jgi:hypothetical protein
MVLKNRKFKLDESCKDPPAGADCGLSAVALPLFLHRKSCAPGGAGDKV